MSGCLSEKRPASNPLTADSNGYYYYYAEGRFDEHISGTGVVAAYTLSDRFASDTLQGRGVDNVKASPYNAAGNGSTDDTSAIAAADKAQPSRCDRRRECHRGDRHLLRRLGVIR